MKISYFTIFLLCSLFFTSGITAGNKDGRILMYARLSAAQEVPAVKTKAKGLVTFTLEEDYKTLTIFGVFDSLSGPVTNCHFHIGSLGVSGGVVLSLLPLVKGNQISGKVTLTKTLLELIDVSGLYINVHTAANPGGEMRGQVYYENDFLFVSVLDGDNELPKVAGPSLGLGSFALSWDETKLEYKILVTGLTGPITGAHLHFGDASTSGPVAHTLSIKGNILTGTLNINAAFLDSLYREKVYVNVHTAANPSGEMRDQLVLAGQVAFDVLADGSGEVTPVNSKGKAVAVGWMEPGLDTLIYLVLYDSISPTAGHFHIGAKGVNGGVVIPFTALAGTPGFVGRIGVRPDTLSKILKGDVYLNLHTTANPGGEIRGQTSTTVREGLVANLCGKQETPSTNSSAVGAGLLSIDRNKTLGHIEMMTSGLTSNASSGHIHLGNKGVAGGVVIDLGINGSTGNAANGVYVFPRTSLADTLINGLGYYNVHTTAFPNGEIRGQITKTVQEDCLSVGIYELRRENYSVKVYPNPMQDVTHLEFKSKDEFKGRVIITDLLGQIISQRNIDVARGSNNLELAVDFLNHGIYFIQLQGNNQLLFSEKVMKR